MPIALTETQRNELTLDIKAFLMEGQQDGVEVYVMPHQFDLLLSALAATDIEHSLSVHLWNRPSVRDLFERCRVAILTQKTGSPPVNLREIVFQWQNEAMSIPESKSSFVDFSKN